MEPFREELYAWFAYDMLRKLFQTSVVIIVQLVAPDYDLFYALFINITALAIHAYARPYKVIYVDRWQTVVLFFHIFVICVCLKQKYTANDRVSLQLDWILIVAQTLITASLGWTICVCAVRENWSELSKLAIKINESPYTQKIRR
eukprot:gene23069-27914_t